MGKSSLTKKKARAAQNKKTFAIAVIIAALAIGFIVFKFGLGADTAGAATGDLKIVKSEVTEIAKFYPYKSGRVNMEVMAVRASDGSIRTAFNTCQICFDSGRGYYEQQGDVMVCQNCGNRFKLDQIEIIKGGCNPVPIMEENKTEDNENIIIPQAFMEENKGLFKNWRR